MGFSKADPYLVIVATGIFATLLMDVWAYALKSVFHLPTPNWKLVGRWFGHLPKGVFVHRPIGASEPLVNEGLIGWIAHYCIGILYAAAYLSIVVVALKKTPTLGSAVIFGLATLAAPWFVLQPGLGLGILGMRAPRSGAVRLVTVSLHTIFGFSLFLGWWLFQHYFS